MRSNDHRRNILRSRQGETRAAPRKKGEEEPAPIGGFLKPSEKRGGGEVQKTTRGHSGTSGAAGGKSVGRKKDKIARGVFTKVRGVATVRHSSGKKSQGESDRRVLKQGSMNNIRKRISAEKEKAPPSKDRSQAGAAEQPEGGQYL